MNASSTWGWITRAIVNSDVSSHSGSWALPVDHRPLTVVRRADQMQVRLALAVPADEVVDQSGLGGENGDCAVLGEQATERLGRSVVREHPRNRRLADLIKLRANLSQIPLGLDTLGELDVLLGDQLGEIPRCLAGWPSPCCVWDRRVMGTREIEIGGEGSRADIRRRRRAPARRRRGRPRARRVRSSR
jgi:hypothetical protein